MAGGGDDDEGCQEEEEEEEEGVSPCKPPLSSASSVPQVELELRLLEALLIYPPKKLPGMHSHFILYGLMEYLRRSLYRSFTADEVLRLLDRFYHVEMLKPDDKESEILKQEEDFSLLGLDHRYCEEIVAAYMKAALEVGIPEKECAKVRL